MKKNIILVLFACGLVSNLIAQGFHLKGKFAKLDTEKRVILSYNDRFAHKQIYDTTVTRDGQFTFAAKLKEPTVATLTLESLDDNSPMSIEKMLKADNQEFYLETVGIEVMGDSTMNTARIVGGKTQADFNLLNQQLSDLKAKMKPLSKKMTEYFLTKNDSAKAVLMPQLAAIREDMTQIEDNFILAHPSSYVSFNLVKSKSVIIDPESFEPFFNALDDRFKNSEQGQKMAASLKVAKRLAIGRPAINFTQNDQNGHPVSLNDFKGKYVLVDFWASWCGPCRAENPNVVKAYNAFKDKNFEIIGISLDDNKAAWLQAIRKDGLPWVQLSDLSGWKNPVAKAYGVQAVPQNFLIDPDGKIIAKNLRGESLVEKLTELIP